MSKVKVKYIGYHQPQEIIEVEQERVAELLATGGFVLIEDAPSIINDGDIIVGAKRKK
jgi:hypothetical protein